MPDYTPLAAFNPSSNYDTRQRIALAMLQQGMDTSPVQAWTQGAARVANALLGAYALKKQNQDDAAAVSDFLKGIRGDNAETPNPTTAPMGNNVTSELAKPGYAEKTVATDQGDTIPLPPVNPLGRLNPEMRTKFADLRTAAADRGVNFNAPEVGSLGNVRTPDQQAALYAQGRTAPGPVVTGTMQSNHLTGNALDVVPTDGTTEKQVGSTVADLIKTDPRFAGMRSGATFSNLYDPLHVELNKPQGTQVASLDPTSGVSATGTPNPSVTNAPQGPQIAQNTPPQMRPILAPPGRAGPAIPPNISAAIDRAILSGSPRAQALAVQTLQQYMKPNTYGFQTLPDGTIVRTNPQTGMVEPVYQGAAKGTDDIKEFEYAKAQGFKGSLADWMGIKRGGAGEYGLNPVWGVGPDGKPALIQLGKGGKAISPTLPEGFQPNKPGEKLDLGTHWGIMNPLTGQVQLIAKKDIEGKEAAEERGKVKGQAQVNLDQNVTTANRTIAEIDALINHKGLDGIVGRFNQYAPSVALNDSQRDALAKWEQVQGRTFLQAYGMLRGGGAITEIEGRKAEQAMAALNRGLSTEDAKAALKTLQDVLREGVRVMRAKAGVAQPNSGGTDLKAKYGLD